MKSEKGPNGTIGIDPQTEPGNIEIEEEISP